MSNTQLNNVIAKVNEHTSDKAPLVSPSFSGVTSIESIGSDILPNTTNTKDIGSSLKRYRKVHTNGLNIKGLLDVSVIGNNVTFEHTSTDTSTSKVIQILDGGILRINDSYNLPVVDGDVGQTLTTDGSGNIIWKSVDSDSSDFAQYLITHNFVCDGNTSQYTVNATTLNQILYVELNGLIQKLGDGFTVTDKTITFSETPPSGMVGTILFWGNDIKSIFKVTDFVTNGVNTLFSTDESLSKVVFVEINGLIQKLSVDYTIDVTNSRINFNEVIPTGSTGTIVYLS